MLGYDLVLGNIYVPPHHTEYHTGEEFDNILDDVVSINADHSAKFVFLVIGMLKIG